MPLARRLTLRDAVAIGLGSMIGAGVFAVWSPALAAAGNGLFIALALAAAVAFCNATSSAQLAAVHPVSGGTYAYGRAEIGEWSGFVAGWCFVIGKIASCAAMAMTFAAYAAPAGWEKPTAIAAITALVVVNCLGVTRTARLTQILVIVTLLGLAVVVAAGAAMAVDSFADKGVFANGSTPDLGGPSLTPNDATLFGILQGAGLLFFAFAGYARIATMGEEVTNPARTIPRAILIALSSAVIIYALVALAVVLTIGAADTASPLADVVTAAGWQPAVSFVQFTAATASLGALLALLTGIGRTTLAMARESDLPTFLARVDDRFQVPRRAEIMIGVIVIAIVLIADVRGAIAFSSFGVLIYYLIANVAAFRQNERRYPRALQVFGAIACATLVVTLPSEGVLIGSCIVGAGLVYRAIRLRVQRPQT